MLQRIAFPALIAASLMLIASCSKNSSDTNPVFNPNTGNTNLHTYTEPDTNYDRSHLNQLFSALRYTPQTFSVTAGQMTTVHGASGTLLTFYPNSFKDVNGNLITGGTVQLKLVEMYKPGSMIANRAITIDNNGILQSGGEVYISATRNNQEVYANKYRIGFKSNGPVSQVMALFYGNANNPDSLVTWPLAPVIATGSYVTGTINVQDSAQGSGTYFLFDSCTSFHWINCDYFYNQQPVTDIYGISPDTSFNASNTCVYLVFPSINSVTNLNKYAAAAHTFDLYPSYKVAVGIGMHIIAITNKNGNYYYDAIMNTTVTDSMVVNLNMQPQTLAYITNALLNL